MSTALATRLPSFGISPCELETFLLGGGGFVAFLIALLAFVFVGTPETAGGTATTLGARLLGR